MTIRPPKSTATVVLGTILCTLGALLFILACLMVIGLIANSNFLEQPPVFALSLLLNLLARLAALITGISLLARFRPTRLIAMVSLCISFGAAMTDIVFVVSLFAAQGRLRPFQIGAFVGSLSVQFLLSVLLILVLVFSRAKSEEPDKIETTGESSW